MIEYLHVRSLPPELWAWKVKIEKIARDQGLDFFETVFEVVGYDKMNEVAAYGGFPTRYPHWKFGMEFEQLSKSYTYGLSKIYELVINTDPCYAYLLEGNELVDQKLVMAHVYGHCDFFKNNYYFSQTNRKMIDAMANHASRIRRYADLHGPTVVEEFIDSVLSLENLIDRFRPYIRRTPVAGPKKRKEDLPDELMMDHDVPRLRANEYMDEFVNPDAYVEAQRQKQRDAHQKESRFPAQPERDVLLFLMEHAPLQKWQRNVVGILREEAYYFAPQGMTKIMNEGWASYWHAKIMTRHVLDDSEIIDYADRHSGTMATSKGRLNPYKLGIELFRNIEERWNRGQFGKEYEDCDDMAERAHWDRRLGLGMQKVFEVRKLYNDVTFLDEFLTPEFCAEQKLFTFGHNRKADEWQIASREFKDVKKKLLFQLTNMGQPVLEVEDANFENRGELLLRHLHEGLDLADDYARETMQNLFKIWTRPVHVATRKGTKGILLTCDGAKQSERLFEVA